MGAAGDDTLDGGTGIDTLQGGFGNDTLIGGAGADTLDGGANTDTIDYSSSDAGVTVVLSDGMVESGGHAEGDTVSNVESIIGSGFADSLTGDTENNVISAGAGADTIFGGDGADRLFGGNDADTIRGNDGDDGVYGDAGADTLLGGVGDDTLDGGSGNDSAYGQDGNDLFVFRSAEGDDYFHGGANGGNDWTDTVNLADAGGNPGAGGWTLNLTSGAIESENASSYVLTADSAGTITRSDDSVLTFEGLEKITW